MNHFIGYILGIKHFLLTFVSMKQDNKKGDELMPSNYIRFDWAMKRLLRNKAYFVVLEGFRGICKLLFCP